MAHRDRPRLKQDICVVGEACTFFIHHCPEFSKAPSMWAQGLLHLCLLFCFSDSTQQSCAELLRRKLRALKVHPAMYTWPRFLKSNAVYIKTKVDWRIFSTVEKYRQPSTMMYVGSTSISVSRRESNRLSVYRKLVKGQEAQAELALRYWASNQSIEQFTIFQVATCSDYQSAWVLEHCLIDAWQPKLNFPFIQSFLKRSALGFKPSRQRRMSSYSKFGRRLWVKLRKKLFTQDQPYAFQLSRLKAWNILYDLTSLSRASFERARQLRSQSFVDDEIYSLIRLSANLQEPLRSKARMILKSVAGYRNMTWPKGSLGIQLQFTADERFPQRMSKWLRSVIIRFKHVLVPFHLPSVSVREKPHQSLKDFLHNVQQWDMWLQHNSFEEIPCTCQFYKRVLPDECFTSGHVTAGLEMLNQLHPACSRLGTGSASSTFFPAKHKFVSVNCKTFHLWRKKHGIPVNVETEFQAMLEEEWYWHNVALKSFPRLTWADVSAVRKRLRREFVVHCEDHEPNHVMVFCPQFYFQSARCTWDDPEVFHNLDGDPESWRQWVLQQVPGYLRKKYPWAIDSKGKLPNGFVFLKRKKKFAKGRTIISYSFTPFSRLLKAASHAIVLMIKVTWDRAFGLEPTPIIWQRLHEFFKRTPAESHLLEVNDDLVGFFNSVPREQILHSLDALISKYLSLGYPPDITVSLKKAVCTETAWPGKPKGKSTKQVKFLRVQDLPDIVQLSFRAGVFQAIGRIFKQHRGTCIGNQISPVLSSLPVIQRELFWQQEWDFQLTSCKFFERQASQAFVCRYVDNRLLICTEQEVNLQCFRDFKHLSFYGSTIQLEPVDDHHFLGFDISASNRTVTFKQPVKPWKLRHVSSAGSWSARASGFFSRKALIVQFAWPPSSRKQQVEHLRNLYLRQGFPLRVLQ